MDNEEREVLESLQIVQERFLGDKDQITKTLQAIYDWRPIREEVISLTRGGQISAAEEITRGKGQNQLARIAEEMRQLNLFARNKAEELKSDADKTVEEILLYLGVLLLSIILVNIGITYVVIKKINKQLADCKEAGEALRTSEARYARAVRGTHDGLWDWNVLTNEDYLSPRWKELLGFTEDELADRYDTFFSRIHPADTVRVQAAIQAHLEQREPYIIEHRLRTKNGDYRWFHVRGQAEWDEQGQAVLMSGSISDITERKRAEEALRTSEAQLSLILANIYDIIFVIAVEPSGRFRFASVNPRFLEVTGLSENQVEGKLIEEVIPEPSLSRVLEKYKEVIRSKRRIQWEEISDYPAGRKVGQVTVAPVFDDNQDCIQLIGTIYDITERKQVEAELGQHRDHLEELVSERTE